MIAAVSPLADLPAIKPVGAEQATLVSIADLSLLPRFGCKGPGAAEWLSALGVAIPSAPNSALSMGELRVLRLGNTEFLAEGDSVVVAKLQAAPRGPGVYPVLRQDAVLLLAGSRANDLLLQSCNVNFAAIKPNPDPNLSPVVLTSMVGVGVTVMPENKSGAMVYRIWCDGTYGLYLWRTLCAIAEELGGGAVGGHSLSA
jgi:sarcosine oxidase subunit gamma